MAVMPEKTYIHILWCDEYPNERAIVGTFFSHEEGEAGWLEYCKSGQWNRDVGSRRKPDATFPHSFTVHEMGHVQTTPYPGDDGPFDANGLPLRDEILDDEDEDEDELQQINK